MTNNLRRLTAASLMAVITAFQASVVAAQTYPVRTETPGWIIERTIYNTCSASSHFNSGTVITLVLNLADELSVTIAHPKLEGDIDFSRLATINYQFSSDAMTGIGRPSSGPPPGFEVLFDPKSSAAFLESWVKSPSLLVYHSDIGQIAGLASGGAPAAKAALLECRGRAELDALENRGATGVDAQKRRLAEEGASRRVSDKQKRTEQVRQHEEKKRQCRATGQSLDVEDERLEREGDQMDDDKFNNLVNEYNKRLREYNEYCDEFLLSVIPVS